MQTKYQHISDPPTFRLKSGETVNGVQIIGVGSPIGRVLFREWAPLIEVEADARDVTISNSTFIGGSISVRLL